MRASKSSFKTENSLERSYLSPSGSPSQTNIKTGAECSRSIVIVLDGVHGAINIGVALVHGVQLELLEDSAGEQESRAVGGGVVGETNLHAIPTNKVSPSTYVLIRFRIVCFTSPHLAKALRIFRQTS